MESPQVRVLLVEDDEDDFVLVRDLLQEIPGNPYGLEWRPDYESGLEAMGRNQHDLCLLDYRLGARSGLELLRAARARGCRGPIILFTGQGERAVDVEAMKAGAADYLIKGAIDSALLERSLRYALERHRDREALRRAHDELEKRVAERTLALEHANEALRQADSRKNEFLAMLSHELRNPLTPIRTGVHILRAPNVNTASIERVLVMMDQQVRNLTRMVDDLLDVSRITRGLVQLQKETIELKAVIGNAVEAVRPASDAQRHKLTVSLPSEPIFLEADPTRLEQVFTNVLMNAVKYTAPGGQINLSVASERGQAIICVRDNGIGLSRESLTRIFEPFTQAAGSRELSQGGLGIGLTLVRTLVEMTGGSVTAQSDGPGTGSEFVIRLPTLAATSRPKRAPTNESAPTKTTALEVLVVEDIEDVAEMLVTLLKLWGHSARSVADGPSALAAVRSSRPDVVLLDIGLAGMNGYDVVRQIRAESGSGRPVIAAVTGYGQDEDRRRSLDAGCDHHLVKPIDLKILQALLGRVSAPCS